jgi:hypothetical protein
LKKKEETNVQAHQVPTHMNMPDKLVFGLTAKQLLITLVGGSAGYDIWIHLHILLAYGLLGLLARLALSLIPAAMALSFALVTVAGRPLETWALVWLRYLSQPKTYVWRSIRFDVRQENETSVEGERERKGLEEGV